MNKFLYFTLFIILISLSIITLFNNSLIINTVLESSKLFLNSLFPSLFPFLILSSFLINYNIIYYIAGFINKIFKIDINLITIFLLSMICGYPSNSKFINEFYNEGLIDEESASKLITLTFFPSPMYVLGTIGYLYLNDYKIGLKILISIYLTNIILLRKFKFKKSLSPKRNKIQSFGLCLSNSIKNAFKTLIIIMGSLTVFMIILNIFNYYFNFNSLVDVIITLILEMSNASKKISTYRISTNLKTYLLTLCLCFGGISIHSQMLSISDNVSINYKLLLLNRVKAMTISFIIIVILCALT